MTVGSQGGFAQTAWRLRFLYLAVPFFGIATGGLYPVIALSLSSRGHSELTIGAVTTTWYFGAFLGAASYAIVVNKLGYRRAFMITALVAAVATWALSLSTVTLHWVLLRLLAGYALGGYYVVVDSWISSLGTDRTRGRLLAFYESVRIVAVAAGPILLTLGTLQSSFLLAGLAFLVGAIPVLLAPTPKIVMEPLSIQNVRQVFYQFPFSMLCIFVSGVIISSFYGLGAIFAEQAGLSREGIAIFVSAGLLAPALTQVPTGALADRFGQSRIVCTWSFLGAFLAAFLATNLTSDVFVIVGLAALIIGLSHPLYPLGLSHAVSGAQHNAILNKTTSALLAYNAGTALGPLFAGQSMELWGHGGLYIWISVCLSMTGATALVTVWRDNRSRLLKKRQ